MGFWPSAQIRFPDLRLPAGWLPGYLMYRALGHYDQAIPSLPAVLARDATSTLIDYYETVIDAIGTVALDGSLSDVRPIALLAASGMLRDGVTDHRLTKLVVALDGEAAKTVLASAPAEGSDIETLADVMCGRVAIVPQILRWPLGNEAIDWIQECRTNGVAAGGAMTSLLKLGVNLKSLDVGRAIANAAHQEASDLVSTRVLSLGPVALSPCLRPEAVAAFPDDEGYKVLRVYGEIQVDGDGQMQTLARSVLSVLDGEGLRSDVQSPNVLHLWLGRQLVAQGRYDQVLKLAEQLSAHGLYWERQSAKLTLWALPPVST